MPEILKTQTVFWNPHSYCGPISYLEKTADGKLLLVFRHADFEGPERVVHAHPSTHTSLIISEDQGQTWSSPVTPDPMGANGVCIADADGIWVINNFHWIVKHQEERESLSHYEFIMEMSNTGMVAALEGVYTTRSRDAGASWEKPRKMEVPGWDQSSTAGKVIQRADGTWLMPMNKDIRKGANTSPWIAASSDQGESWSFLAAYGEEIEHRFAENRILALPENQLLSLVRTEVGNFWQSHSSDGGQTWSAIQETPIPCLGSSPADLLLLEDGRVLCTYGNRKRDPMGVRACLSEDGGQTWNLEEEIILRDDATHHDMGYPSSQQLNDGSILTVYYWQDENQVRHLVSTQWKV